MLDKIREQIAKLFEDEVEEAIKEHAIKLFEEGLHLHIHFNIFKMIDKRGKD